MEIIVFIAAIIAAWWFFGRGDASTTDGTGVPEWQIRFKYAGETREHLTTVYASTADAAESQMEAGARMRGDEIVILAVKKL